ncbi:hypothetical protein BDW75DRAFT_211497 [Aspergillus navahoensis]
MIDPPRVLNSIQTRGRVLWGWGYCVLLNTKLSDGAYLVAGRNMAGFAAQEEVLARVSKLVPYNAEEKMKKRGTHYEKGRATLYLLHRSRRQPGDWAEPRAG